LGKNKNYRVRIPENIGDLGKALAVFDLFITTLPGKLPVSLGNNKKLEVVFTFT